jgi:neopullulanase
VTALWLTPWYDNANQLNHREKYTRANQLSPQGDAITDYHGYGAVDFYAPEEHFGDLRLLRELVQQAHARGLKVIQDQVANHTGPYHRWVSQPPAPRWFNGSADRHLENNWQTWTVVATNPPLDKLKATLEGWFINILPDLNQNDPETANYLIQNSLWWVGMTGLDAIRQDTLPYVPRSYWSRWPSALKREYPTLTILGEMWDGDPKLVSLFQGGRTHFDGVDSGVEALFDFPLHNAIREVFIQGASMTRLTGTLAADTNYVNPFRLVPFLGLHDTSRFLHASGATAENMRLAFSFLLTTRGTPMIYYGDEIGMNGGGDPDNRRDFPGGWREDVRNAFEASSRTPEQAAMYAHVNKLLALRRELAPLRRGALLNLSATRETYAFARTAAEDAVLVALNNSTQPQRFDLAVDALPTGNGRTMTDRLGRLDPVEIRQGKINFVLAPKTAAVLTLTRESAPTRLAHEAPK